MEIVEIIKLLITCLWIPLFVNIVIPGKYGKKRIICTIVLIIVYIIVILIGGGTEVLTVLYILISMLTIYLTIGHSMWKMLSIPVAYMVCVLCNYSIEIVWHSIVDNNLANADNADNAVYSIIEHIIMTCMIIVVSFAFRLVVKGVSNSIHEGIINDMKVVIIGNVVLYTLVFLINGYAIRQMGYPENMMNLTYLLFLIYGLLTIGVTVLSFRGLQNKEKRRKEEEVKKNLLEYTTQVESMYEGLRSFKHDYVNILAAMSGYLEKEDMEGLKKYFNENILPTNEAINRESYHLQKLSKIQDPAMKGLISSKLIYAHSMGADVFVDIVDEVKPIAMRDVDATRVLGIYLDNAIEAALETTQKEIKFNIVCDVHSTTIVLMNSFLDKGLAVEKMDQKGATTKGEGHGIGLSNVNEVLRKYKNICKMTEIKDGYFVQTLIVEEK